MIYADVVTSPDTPTVITAFVTIIGLFVGMGTIMLKSATKDREADRRERENLAKAIDVMAKASIRVADATVKSAKEAKDRNGHLAEQTLKIAQVLDTQNSEIHGINMTLKASAITLAKETKDVAIHVAEVKTDLIDAALIEVKAKK